MFGLSVLVFQSQPGRLKSPPFNGNASFIFAAILMDSLKLIKYDE